MDIHAPCKKIDKSMWAGPTLYKKNKLTHYEHIHSGHYRIDMHNGFINLTKGIQC